ncbi:glycoside hydrolase family 2 TIM barrel-domain containing protein [Paenibacillus chungangensis]|uniref:Glycoside hydrolase family 2 TIM barrel-domain containing protein n=1 Tax=Paenibacillus chungangensis TaxID=696535 RepID=A0ABW3HW15_9BACL
MPHSVRIEPADCSGGLNYQGVAWYRRHFYVQPSSRGRKLFVEFEGAKHTAEIWMNGTYVGIHHGGYLPFTLDISSHVIADGLTSNVIAVRLDNSDAVDIPPGKPQSELDFCYFGGLYRHVWLYETDTLHITDAVYANQIAGGGIFVTYPHVTDESAVINAKIHVHNEDSSNRSYSIRSLLYDEEQQLIASYESKCLELNVGEACHYHQKLEVLDPKLWHPDHPYLYCLVTIVMEEGQAIDQITTRIGIRTLRFDSEGFYLNHKPLLINGANRHQEYVYVGDALPDSMQKRDAIKLKEAGFNFVRIGHYPQSHAFMDACDEVGLMCVVPVPGWQWFRDNDTFKEGSYQDVRDMIRRDRNHPCVMFWEPILNETHYSEEYARITYRLTHEEYPGDQCYAACDMHSSGADQYDIWYGNGVSEQEWGDAKPIFIREYGDNYREQFGPQKTQNRCSRGTKGFYNGGESGMLISALERLSYLNDHFLNQRSSGAAVWTGIDHNRGYVPNIAATGVMDFYRFPKFSYYVYSSQRNPELEIKGIENKPVLFIANDWNADSSNRVYVFSNCDSVTLYVNGKEISTSRPSSQYAGLPHPPFIFDDVPFEPGELRAEGYLNGQHAATHSVRTAGAAHHFKLKVDDCGIDLVADGSDLVLVQVWVCDEQGTVVTDAYREVQFHIDGPGVIVGDGEARVHSNPIETEAGAIGVLIQATTESGIITVTASAEGLQSDSIQIASRPDCRNDVPGPEQLPPVHKPQYAVDLAPQPLSTHDSKYNLAYMKPVKASSEQSQYPAAAVTDSNLITRWCAADSSTPQWLEVELEQTYDLTGCKVAWESDNTNYEYKVETSADGEHWTTCLEKFGTGQDIKPDVFASEAVRFIRVTILSVSKGAASIYSLGVYGTKAGAAR